jgi:hypothetical protein
MKRRNDMKNSHLDKIVAIIMAVLGPVFLLLLMSTVSSTTAKADSALMPRAISTATGTLPSPRISLAYNRPVTSPSVSCSADEGPAKAVNGTWLYGLADNWCTSSNAKWIDIDLGGNYYITRVEVIHAGGAGGPSRYNTRTFSIGRSLTAGPKFLTMESVVDANSGWHTWSYPTSMQLKARYIRLRVTQGAQPNEANVARIYDVLIYGVPAP